MNKSRTYIAIDLKSFYASVECVERGLDPLTTNLVVADDIHPYSIDEVFIDATDYLKLYQLSAKELAMKMIKAILKETGITATAGIGTNQIL